ncbi:hypothetical protein [Streptomyces sp. N2A]|uniref:hypothetical protein n=1 Tax=Streptomyces sp. N2A TaxID=3073936 RepID=UPI00287049A0|nr:hypothetical protein [Streptomyces sp. N2A]
MATGPDGVEIIEAKSSTDHADGRPRVRTSSPRPAAGLRPAQPVRFRAAPHVFERLAAPGAARDRMHRVWTNS